MKYRYLIFASCLTFVAQSIINPAMGQGGTPNEVNVQAGKKDTQNAGATPIKRSGKQLKRKTRSTKRKRMSAQSEVAKSNSIELKGTFSIRWGDLEIAKGEGSVRMDLSDQAVTNATTAASEQIGQLAPVANSYLTVLAQVPATIQTTGEILKSLSDPKVQENLQQVQQILQMYQAVSGNIDLSGMLFKSESLAEPEVH